MLALTWELGDQDPVIRLARSVPAGLADKRGSAPVGRERRIASTRARRDAERCLRRSDAPVAPRSPRRPGPGDRKARRARRPWNTSGSYLEACNCTPICARPRAGGRRPRRICSGALSRVIEQRHPDDIDLASLAIALAFRHIDDPSAAWDVTLNLDDHADDHQQSAPQALFTGRLGRRTPVPFPWASKSTHPLKVRAVPIAADHRDSRPWFDAGHYVSVRLGDPLRGIN
jgi:hypothetical protein